MSQGGAELQSWLSCPEQVPASTLPSLKWVSSATALTLPPKPCPQCSEASAVFEGRVVTLQGHVVGCTTHPRHHLLPFHLSSVGSKMCQLTVNGPSVGRQSSAVAER